MEKTKSYENYLRAALSKAKKDFKTPLEQEFIESLQEMEDATDILKTIVDIYNAGAQTETEKTIRTVIIAIFWYELDDYIKQTVHKYAGEYLSTDPTIFEDICHDCFIAILDKMKNYNPKKSAPNTYFTTEIMHAALTFTDKKFSNSTAHYGFALKRIKKRIEELKSKNITATTEGLARDLNISLTTVRGCLDIMNNSTLVYIEDTETEKEKNSLEGKMTNNISSPEDIYLEGEEYEYIKDILTNLTPIEKKVFVLSVYSSLSNRDIATKLKISTGMVSTLYERACKRLRMIPQFKTYNAAFEKRKEQQKQGCNNIILQPLNEDVAIKTEKYVISLFANE